MSVSDIQEQVIRNNLKSRVLLGCIFGCNDLSLKMLNFCLSKEMKEEETCFCDGDFGGECL